MAKLYKWISSLGDISSISSATINQSSMLSSVELYKNSNIIDAKPHIINDKSIIDNNIKIINNLSYTNPMIKASTFSSIRLEKNVVKSIDENTKKIYYSELKRFNLSEKEFDRNYSKAINGSLKVEDLLKKVKHHVSNKIDLSKYFKQVNTDTAFRRVISIEDAGFEIDGSVFNRPQHTSDATNTNHSNQENNNIKMAEKLMSVVALSEEFDKYANSIRAFFYAQATIAAAKTAFLALLIAAAFWSWNLWWEVAFLSADVVMTIHTTKSLDHQSSKLLNMNYQFQKMISNKELKPLVNIIKKNKLGEIAKNNLDDAGKGLIYMKFSTITSINRLIKMIPMNKILSSFFHKIGNFLNTHVWSHAKEIQQLLKGLSKTMPKAMSIIQGILLATDVIYVSTLLIYTYKNSKFIEKILRIINN